MSVTYFSANQILDRNFGTTSYSPASNYFFALSTTTINIDGSGCTEPSGGSYARTSLANNKTNFSVAASASLTNLTQVAFVESTASWGTIVAVAMFDALSSGSMWWFDVLTPSRTIASSTTVLFAIGAITVQMIN